MRLDERKKMEQTNKQSTQLQQIPIILHAIQSPCNPLQETLSEIFFRYDQTHYLMAATEIIKKMMVYSPVQPPYMALSSKELYCFYFTDCFSMSNWNIYTHQFAIMA